MNEAATLKHSVELRQRNALRFKAAPVSAAAVRRERRAEAVRGAAHSVVTRLRVARPQVLRERPARSSARAPATGASTRAATATKCAARVVWCRPQARSPGDSEYRRATSREWFASFPRR